MASSILKETKDGRKFYEIRVSQGRGLPRATMRWYVPEGWSAKTIQRELAKQSRDFEKQIQSGEILTKAKRKEQELKDQEKEERTFTVSKYAEKVFMAKKTISIAEASRRFYQSMLDNHIIPEIGQMKIDAVSSPIISAMFFKKQSCGVSYETLHAVYITLIQLFKMAYMDDLMEKNPMDKVEKPRKPKDEKTEKSERVKAFSAEEITYIRKCLENEPLKWQAYTNLAIETGCRNGELCGLKWSKINFDTNTILIDNNIVYTPQKGVYESSTKTGKIREVYITAETAKLLKAYKAELHGDKKESESGEKTHKIIDINAIRKSDYVFVQNESAMPMHPQSPGSFFRRFGEKYKIADIHPHKFRHSFASIAIVNGVDVASVSEILGHANKSTTLNMYTHASTEAKRRAAEITHIAQRKKA